MANTLVLYDGKMSSTERASKILGCIIGNVKRAELGEAPEDLSPYSGFCFIFNFYGAVTVGKTKAFLAAHQKDVQNRKLAFVGIGISDAGFFKYAADMEKTAHCQDSTAFFISDDRQLVQTGCEIAKKMHASAAAMEESELLSSIEQFIQSHNTLALALSAEGYIRCTPLEYVYSDSCFYIITEGGLKFRCILENDKVSAAIYDNYSGMESLNALRIFGSAEIIDSGTAEYKKVLAGRKVAEEVLQKLPVELFLIKITPLKYDYLCSGLKKQGFDILQSMNTVFRKKTWADGAILLKQAEEKQAEEEKAEEGQPEESQSDEALPHIELPDEELPAEERADDAYTDEAAEDDGPETENENDDEAVKT